MTNKKQTTGSGTSENRRFPTVGIGASAGGLEALKEFFTAVASDSGIAYVVVVHLSPDQPSVLDQLLQHVTHVPVSVACDGETIGPDHIYVTPPNKVLNVYQGHIQLLEKVNREVRMPIDAFFRSLAQDNRTLAAVVVLSGTGTDGSAGAREVKQQGGAVIVQSPETARYGGMPSSVIDAGTADMVLPPKEMAENLSRYFRNRSELDENRLHISDDEQQKWLNKILSILRTQLGHDFGAYKKTTLIRRINRRMGLQQISEYHRYLRFLRETPGELESLFREMLINVTHFFRDQEAYDVLKSRVLPDIVSSVDGDEPLRVWVPGCSTGEEVYSIAIVMREALDRQEKSISVQLFGTDIDEVSIVKARSGVYPASAVEDIGTDRLSRYFSREGDSYRIRKSIRDVVVFSVQNVLKDPPFSQIHLLSCRNLLIYIESRWQKKLIPLFHYSLKPNGILMLGNSENIAGFSGLFAEVDKKWKIYRKKDAHPLPWRDMEFSAGTSPEMLGRTDPERRGKRRETNIKELVHSVLLERFIPASVLVDRGGSIRYVQGKTGRFLETGTGFPTQDIVALAKEGLKLELSSALREAGLKGRTVNRAHIPVDSDGGRYLVAIRACPLQEPAELKGMMLVTFDVEAPAAEPASSKSAAGGHTLRPDSRIRELEQELQNTRMSYQEATDELQSANEELQSANEELKSSNEELRSTNEELESSKEELQSLNEELHTVNAELQSKLSELTSAQDDFRNLLNSTEIAALFVDGSLRIVRFTPKLTGLFNVIPSDVGRPFAHVTSNLVDAHIAGDLEMVISQLSHVEREVRSADGEWFKMRIIPYRTTENRIEGAVLTFADIDSQKEQQKKLQELTDRYEEAWELVRDVFNMNSDPLVVIERDGTVVISNSAFVELMNIDRRNANDTNILSMNGHGLQQPQMQAVIKDAIDNGRAFVTAPMLLSSDRTGRRRDQHYAIHARTIVQKKELPPRLLLHFKESADEGEAAKES